MSDFVQSGTAVDIAGDLQIVSKRSVVDSISPHVRRIVKLVSAIGQKKRTGIERVHQLRTEARRLTAAINLFDRWLPRDLAEKKGKRIRQIRQKAGSVRDLDVLMSSLKNLNDLLSNEVIKVLTDRADSLRTKKARSLAVQCEKLIDNGFEDNLTTLVRQISRRGKRDCPGSANNGMPTIRELAREFETGQEHLTADTDHLHRFRKAARHLRYSLELIGEFSGDPQIDRPCELLSGIQDKLGQFNDQVTLLDFLVCCEKAIDQQSIADALRHAIHFLEARIPEQTTSLVLETVDDSRNVLAILNR